MLRQGCAAMHCLVAVAQEGQVLKSTTVHTASKAGSLTGGGLTLGVCAPESFSAQCVANLSVLWSLQCSKGEGRTLGLAA